jgi:hypothetical protein
LETLAALRGGQSGKRAVIAGRANTSPLIRFVRDEVEDLEMPPLAERPGYAPLSKDEIQRLSLWIDQGFRSNKLFRQLECIAGGNASAGKRCLRLLLDTSAIVRGPSGVSRCGCIRLLVHCYELLARHAKSQMAT